LGICAAIASSFSSRPLMDKTVLFGEVGLSGELRAVSQAENRVREAKRLGFKNVVLPNKNLKDIKNVFKDINFYGADILREALTLALPREG
ncbi:MAG: DNA repair protein RadA, partial [Selenomonadaceae bacterium]|nr:DNA repair protein RadA [Selenomonadaceae bacterium]